MMFLSCLGYKYHPKVNSKSTKDKMHQNRIEGADNFSSQNLVKGAGADVSGILEELRKNSKAIIQ